MSFRIIPDVAVVNVSVVTTIIFDADDTLWDTQPLYERSKNKFYRIMRKSGFRTQEVAERFEAIDHANVSKLGFSKKRFPQSMRDTYGALCTAYARPFEEEIANLVSEIGSATFEIFPRVFDGVKETLSKLRLHDVKLLLATKGDREVQALRLNASGLGSHFDGVHILEEKGVREFTRLISHEHIELSRGWSVGNSARSDINPALAVGLNAIWIPRKTWMYEEIDVVSNQKLHIAESITEIPRIVLGEL